MSRKTMCFLQKIAFFFFFNIWSITGPRMDLVEVTGTGQIGREFMVYVVLML